MPLYEYVCPGCRTRFTELVRGWSAPSAVPCPRCGAESQKVLSTFAYHKSEKTIHEESGEPSLTSGPDFYKDPRNIGRWTEKKFKDMGMDMPAEVRESIDAARDGELPEALKET